MPATLPQLSRRKFLKSAALAGTAAAFAPRSYAALFSRKNRDPHTFVLLSDSHIASDPKAIHSNVTMAENLAACVLEIVKLPTKPGGTIVNGDLALSTGLPGDYKTFGRLLHPLRSLAPIHLSLGNHDERDNFWQAFPRDATPSKAVPDKQIAVIVGDHANWFLLDSLEKTMLTPGSLGKTQMDWLAHELEARPEKPAMVVCHHPLDPTGSLGLKDTPAFEDLLARHKQVKAFIFGHTHNWNVTQHPSGIHLVNLPPTAYTFQAGRPSGWVRATLAKDGAEFELRCLDQKHPEHGTVVKVTWRA